MIHVDTSSLIASLSGDRTALPRLAAYVRDGERLGLSTLVLYEWWRGPRTPDELRDQERLFPRAAAFPFGAAEAQTAAELYARLRRPAGRTVDIAIAACALVNGAALWTLNPSDFRDIPGLDLAG